MAGGAGMHAANRVADMPKIKYFMLTSVFGFCVLPYGKGYAQYIRQPKQNVGGDTPGFARGFAEYQSHEVQCCYHDADGKTGRGISAAGRNGQRHTDEGEY